MIKVEGTGRVVLETTISKFHTIAYTAINYEKSYEVMLITSDLPTFLTFQALRKKSKVKFSGTLTESKTDPGYTVIDVTEMEIIKR